MSDKSALDDWRPIETVPEVVFGQRYRALLYSRQLGVVTGECGHFMGSLFATVPCFHGNAVDDWGVTHWMPLPEAPSNG